MTILAAHKWATNGDLIADVAGLGFIHGSVLDATYGEGVFWSKTRPEGLITNDLYKPADHQFDFTSFPPSWGDRYDCVVFDPPYKLNGTPTEAVDGRYGVDKVATLQERLDLIVKGAIECMRLVRTGGYLLVKCQDQVASGRMHFQSDLITQALDTR